MGAGKTSIGRVLAARLQRRFVDLDRLIEEQAGADIPLIFEMEGESGFRRRESAMLATQLIGDGAIIACGGGIILDPDNRARLRERAFVIHLEASVDEQLTRLCRDRSRPLLQTDDRRTRLQALAAARDPLYAQVADMTFHAGNVGPTLAAQELVKRLDPDLHVGHDE